MLTTKERIEKICRKCVNWIDEEEADLTNDVPHCTVDYLGLTTYVCEVDTECDHFFER